MNKLKIKFVISTCLLLILPNIQVLSQNQSSYRLINNKSEELASSALKTLVNKVFPHSEYKVEFSAKGGPAFSGGTYSLSSRICFYQLKVYPTHGGLENLYELRKLFSLSNNYNFKQLGG